MYGTLVFHATHVISDSTRWPDDRGLQQPGNQADKQATQHHVDAIANAWCWLAGVGRIPRAAILALSCPYAPSLPALTWRRWAWPDSRG